MTFLSWIENTGRKNVATLLNVSKSAVHSWASLKRPPQFDNAHKIKKITGLDYNEIFKPYEKVRLAKLKQSKNN